MEQDNSDLFEAFGAPSQPAERSGPAGPPSDLMAEGSQDRGGSGSDDLKAAFAEGSKEAKPTVTSTSLSPFVGFNQGLVSAIGAPVDFVNWSMGKLGIPGSSEAPFAGSESIKRGLDIAGSALNERFGTNVTLNPYAELYKPRSKAEEYLQAGGKGVGETTVLAAAAPAVSAHFAAREMPKTAEAIQTVLGMRPATGLKGDSVAARVAELGVPAFTGSVGAEAAKDLVPESWKGLAGVGGGLAGGTIGALGVAGAKTLPTLARGTADFFAPMTEAGRTRKAAEALGEGFGSSRAALDVIENEPRTLVEGSKPTTFELTGQGGQLQRRAETIAPERFIERRGDQAAARIAELEKNTPEAEAASLSGYLRQKLTDFDEATNKAIAAAEERAQTETGRLGGEGTPEGYGADLRQSLATAKETARQERETLYNAIDPENKINIVVSPIRGRAEELAAQTSEFTTPLTGEAKRLFELAQNLPEVIPFSGLREYDKAITAAMSAERRAAGETPVWGQLSQLKKAVQETIAKGVENQSEWEQSAVAAGKMAADDTIAARVNRYAEETGAGPVAKRNEEGSPTQPATFQTNLDDSPVYYPHGQVRVKYEVVDANDLVTSHDRDFRVRPDYPAELQPRDRASVPAQNQVNKIAADLQPERLGPSPEVNTGAPIIGPDNIVESGNGRTLAIQKAYEAGRGEDYRAWLESQGFNTQGIERPVLVGRRISEMTPNERVIFAQSANDPTGLAMNAVERAAADAKILGDITTPIVPGPLSSAENREFVRQFASRLTPNERATLVDKDGVLSQKGELRIRAALSASAYEDPAFLSRIFESTDNNIKAIGDALSSVAGPWAKMRQAASRGDIAPEHDITDKLMDAVRLVMRARDEDKPLGFYLAQTDMFASPVEQLAKDIIMPNGKTVASGKTIRNALATYAEEAQKNLAGARLVGEALSPEEVLRGSAKRAAEAAQGEEIISAGKPGLTPNMTPESAAALTAAKEKHADYAQTYREGPVGDVLRTTGFTGQYRQPNAAVVGKFFPSGDKGFEAASAFRKAVGDDEKATAVMRDYIAYSMRRQAERPDGTIDPKKFETWRKNHDSALRAFPELEGQFDDAVRASKLVGDLNVAKKQAVDDYQKGIVGKLLGLSDNQDVVKTVGSIFTGQSPVKQMKMLAGAVADNPDAQAGLKRSVADYIARQFVTTTKAEMSKDAKEAATAFTMRSANFQKFVRDNRDVLKVVFNDKELASIEAIAADLNRSARSVTGTGLAGRSTTAQDLAPALAKKGEADLSLLNKLALAGEAGAQLSGVKGFLAGVGSVVANAVTANMRKAGLEKVDAMIVEAMLNPDVAATLLRRIPDERGATAVQALNSMFKRMPTIGFLGTGEDIEQRAKPLTIRPNREGRASGGRTNGGIDQAAEDLIRAAESTKKALGRETEALLNHDDNTIAQALEVANKAI